MRALVPIASVAVALAAACSRSDRSPGPPEPAPGAGASAPDGSDARPHHRTRDGRREPAIAGAPPLQLTVTVGGAPSTWRRDAFAKVPPYTRNTNAGDGEARDAWSLRELAHTLVGPTARVTSVAGEGGVRSIDRAAWDDPSRTPLLHTTRRGTLKFRWADAGGTWGETEVRDVTRIEIAP